MEINEFWDLIERSRAVTSDLQARTVWLEERLAEGSVDDVLDFSMFKHQLDLRTFTWSLWGATSVMANGFYSDASFDYFREWLIGLGRDVYERVVDDPDSLADLAEVQELAAKSGTVIPDIPEWEDLVMVPYNAYEAITGADDVDAEDALDQYNELWGEPRGDGWDFRDKEETRRRLPRLYALFNENS
ncbi:DUF4240 domain-containing protein [Microtetraspora sp. AC03309]|uniref:DUF4240 domain-containing protein n=1 Tax=Microtetraspora sp. AC03309 TaxID=2779376 RepID=UPI001E3ED2D4|nr:DUF4240 domain-containing protein [Microtetraspora sp. AC03309]MCC5581333.1 DUF4240 domain-containing protein [Microtetraspora sp. AC03309]